MKSNSLSVTLGKPSHLSVPPFPHLRSGDADNIKNSFWHGALVTVVQLFRGVCSPRQTPV